MQITLELPDEIAQQLSAGQAFVGELGPSGPRILTLLKCVRYKVSMIFRQLALSRSQNLKIILNLFPSLHLQAIRSSTTNAFLESA